MRWPWKRRRWPYQPKNWAVIYADRNYTGGSSCHCWTVSKDGLSPVVPENHEPWCPVAKGRCGLTAGGRTVPDPGQPQR